MPEHSPEPWRTADGEAPFTVGPQIIDSAGMLVVSTNCDDPHDSVSQVNARRIAACVNFCQGLSTDWLEKNRRVEWG